MDQKLLQQILEELREVKQTMVTKEESKSFLTKKDAQNFLTKDDATSFATKDDLRQLKAALIEEIKESEGFIVGSADRNKAEKAVVEDHEKRISSLERKLTA